MYVKKQIEKKNLNFAHFLNNLLKIKPFSHSIGLRHATVKISSNSIIYNKSYRLKNVENFKPSFLETAKMRVTWFFH
jgi:hypothetical protein